MYDYNFPTSLTAEQLTMLLLSLVIPTDNVVLKKIYKKKIELEIEDNHKDYAMIEKYRTCRYYVSGTNKVNILYRMLFTQIQSLYPGFIMCDVTKDIAVNTRPLTEWRANKITGKRSKYPVPSGVSVINNIFREPPLDFMKDSPSVNEEYYYFTAKPNYTLIHTDCSAGLMNSAAIVSRFDKFGRLVNAATGCCLDAFDEIYNDFRKIGDIIKSGNHPVGFWYDTLVDLNEDKGIRVDSYQYIEK